ncbi:MAG TPA: hypothetical protein PK308_00290 [Phycisphaerales bacterium]|nr:hypothetical protein [Phycisphaerales bacterium]
MNLLALDLSLTGTGWATNGTHGAFSGVFGAEDLTGLERIASLRDDCLRLAWKHGPDLVVIEGLVATRFGNASLDLAGLGWAVRLGLHAAGIPYVDVAPTSLKKFATGKGNATKIEVLKEAWKRLGYEGTDDNEADALWLLHAGLHHYGAQRLDLPKVNLEALAKVHWPALGVEA